MSVVRWQPFSSAGENDFAFTEDLIYLANTGQLKDSYGRKPEFAQLLAHVSQGVVIVHGPPGTGKTALIEKLAYRIAWKNKKIPSLHGARLLRLKWSYGKEGGTVEKLVSDMNTTDPESKAAFLKLTTQWSQYLADMWKICSGGSSNKKVLAAKVSALFSQLKPSDILVIDEVQDLLEDITFFDDFKERLARGKIKLIGMTTNEELVNRLRNREGSGAGMKRRIQTIEMKEMSQQETVNVVKKAATKRFCSYHLKKVVYDKGVFQTITLLAKRCLPDKIFPDAAISLLEMTLQFGFDLQKGDKILINDKTVTSFLAQFTGQEITQTVQSQAKGLLLLLEKPKTPLDCLSEAIARIRQYFKGSNNFYLFLEGHSETLLIDFLTLSSQPSQQVYQCDVSQFINWAEDLQKQEFLQLLEGVGFRGQIKPLLVLKGFKEEWLEGPPSAPAPPTLETTVSHLLQGVGQAATDGAISLPPQLLSMAQLASQMAPAAPPPPKSNKPRVPTIITELMAWVEKHQVPTIILLTPLFSQPMIKREKWAFFSMKSFSLSQILEYMNAKLQKQEPSNLALLHSILFAFYFFNKDTFSKPPMDLALQAISGVNLHTTSPEQAIFQTLEGRASQNEVAKALERSRAEVPCDPVTSPAGLALNRGLEQKLAEIQNSSKTSILWIEEQSLERQKRFISQMASAHGVMDLRKAPWLEIQEELKESFLQIYLSQFAQTASSSKKTILLVSEEGLKDTMFQNFILKDLYTLVCFQSPLKTPSGSEKKDNSTSPINQGVQLLTTLAQNIHPLRSYAVNAPSYVYTPPPLTLKETQQILESKLFAIKEKELKKEIVSLYLLFKEKPLDQIARRLSSDIGTLQQKLSPDIFKQFAEWYGEELNMSLQEIQYEVNPSKTSLFYQTSRLIGSTLKQGASLLFAPVRWMISWPVALGAFLMDVCVNRLASKIRDQLFANK